MQRFNFPARRMVEQGEAAKWLALNPAPAGASIVTSMPDWSEMGGMTLPIWQEWFTARAAQIMSWIPEDGVCVFYQSDIYHHGEWIDKSFLLMQAKQRAKAYLWWHKIVCRRQAGSITPGRPSYSHLLCFTRKPPKQAVRPGPDVISEAGYMAWSRAMGETACQQVCRFLKNETATTVVVDPFCGTGSVLAVANSMGFAALGVDLSPRRVRASQLYALRQ